jgi:predicted TPR repeat methyltransferase
MANVIEKMLKKATTGKLDKTLSVRMTTQQHEALKHNADLTGVSMSDLMLEAAQESGLFVKYKTDSKQNTPSS